MQTLLPSHPCRGPRSHANHGAQRGPGSATPPTGSFLQRDKGTCERAPVTRPDADEINPSQAASPDVSPATTQSPPRPHGVTREPGHTVTGSGGSTGRCRNSGAKATPPRPGAAACSRPPGPAPPSGHSRVRGRASHSRGSEPGILMTALVSQRSPRSPGVWVQTLDCTGLLSRPGFSSDFREGRPEGAASSPGHGA